MGDQTSADVQQGPPQVWTRWGHLWHPMADENGYAVCAECGARENTDESVAQCPESVGGKRIVELEAQLATAEEAARRTWHTMDAAPSPGFITQAMRDAIVVACEGMDPLPWEDAAKAGEGSHG